MPGKMIQKMISFFLTFLLVLPFIGCGDAEDTTKSSSPRVVYQNADEIEGTYKDNDYFSEPWQTDGVIRSEVKVFMDIATWAVDYESDTYSFETDLDGDGEDDEIAIENDPETNTLAAFLRMNGKEINLFDAVSDEFLETMSMMVSDGYFVYGSQIQVAAIDLNGDDKKEILLGAGDDNGVLAVSIFKYSGGRQLYKETCGIVGTRNLRYISITRDNTLFAQLFFTNEASMDSQPLNYVEYAYKNGTLKAKRYRNE